MFVDYFLEFDTIVNEWRGDNWWPGGGTFGVASASSFYL